MSDPETSTDRHTGLWSRQFDPVYDFPTVPVKTKVALCTTPRCGSHFLGHKLHSLGAFGYPLEYLNPGNWEIWDKRAGETPTLDFIKSKRTGPNGVFAVKLHHEHLTDFLVQEPEPLTYNFIHLRRRDLTRQAISFARAEQTGAWISDMPEIAPAYYDWGLIATKMDHISRGNADWQGFLQCLGIQPLELYYEDIVADMSGALARIADYTDVRIDEAVPDAGTFTPERQKRQAQADWLARFEADSRDRLAKGDAIPGVSYPDNIAVLRHRARKVAKRLKARAGL
ncbi:Stf0 family sulfotransferase [Cognatiyoonia sp. IB215182]|uniref:Stf0 family sulfotransferase n=1 Tax=Cognatiyoonia sp. IB215182 TaxID=3097353 RepID=UPI002A0EC535|nr:Stf0 family sulfotransferase [Cognatiyoonia sp. IB215182]MDX8354998.1 Stf0 family sulfotransferase [Cognatiyoonia sp. IB215182]